MNSYLTFTGIFLAVASLASAQVWLSHLRIETSQQTYSLQQAAEEQRDKIQILGLEYASLARPNRLRKLAHRKLGMRAPQPMQVIQP